MLFGSDAARFIVACDAVTGQLQGFGQLKELAGVHSRSGGGGGRRRSSSSSSSRDAAAAALPPPPPPVELSSLVVLKGARGAGLGSRLIAALLERAGAADVFLTTIESRRSLYLRAGFEEVPLLLTPPPMLLEVAAGLVVARLAAGERLVVMKRPGGSGGDSWRILHRDGQQNV